MRLRPWSVAAALACMGWSAVAQEVIVDARYEGETEAYAHCVLGDCVEYSALRLTVQTETGATEDRVFDLSGLPFVFEDTAPRLWDVTGDGLPEVVVVRSSFSEGAALVIYGPEGPVAETAPIGQRNRWLAPVGAADLDGDGHIEIGYVDRPHLARTLRVLRYRDGALEPVALLAGVSNHRIGEPDIGGGLRDCVATPELIVASGDWRRVLAVRLEDGALAVRDAGPHIGRSSFADALRC